MSGVWDYLPESQDGTSDHRSARRAMGAEERRRWSSLVRQNALASIVEHLGNTKLRGVAITGPRGVGKTTLARLVETNLYPATQFVNIFGTGSDADVPYGAFHILMADLSEHQTKTPASILQGLIELIKQEAHGRPTVIILDDLPGIDIGSMAVLMQLLLSGAVKLLVMARNLSELPEDLVWMIKDGLMATEHLDVLTRAEVRTLLAKALDASVAESVVSAFHTSSAGNPLVLQAVVNESLRTGALRKHAGVWVLVGPSRQTCDNILEQLLESRLASFPASVRTNLEKFALLRRVPLSVAMHAVGPEAVSQLEELDFLTISNGVNSEVWLSEPYIGETLRTGLKPTEKARHFKEMSRVLSMDPVLMDKSQLLAFAAWVNDAGLVLDPKAALAAAHAAVDYFDPILALACCAHIPQGHRLTVQVALVRSQAYFILANYKRAVDSLEGVAPDALANLSLPDYASWALELTGALLWVPGGYARVEALLSGINEHIQSDATETSDQDRSRAWKFLQLARFELQVHRGEFSTVVEELTNGSADQWDKEYRVNCASLLTIVMAVTGRELDAVELSERISAEMDEHLVKPNMRDWHLMGRVLALIWSGEWRACESIMADSTEVTSGRAQYPGGVMELTLGLAYTYAGRGAEAADILLVAAAQLEVRDTYNSLQLVYSALAFAFAQIQDVQNARSYLAKAQGMAASTHWVNTSMTEFFQLMALRWLGDATAPAQLVASAKSEIANGRFTTASILLFGATTSGNLEQYQLLMETSLMRQGPMAAVNATLARAHLEGSAELALEAADGAHKLELASVESRCVVVALELAQKAGSHRISREAQRRLEVLVKQVPVLPVSPRQAAVALTTRERQVATLAAKGIANREIASRIGVSTRTVEGHLYQVFSKMGITSRSELE